jgi:primosomal protein N' (replication factor Y) (superfamily II helicase)
MLVSVAVPVPSLPLLTYRVPAGDPLPGRGTRVLVPLGRRTVTGLVTGTADAGGVADDAIRELAGVLDDGASFLPDGIVDLALWVSEYYLAAPGEALSTAMPPFAWVESESRYELTASGAAMIPGASAGPGLPILTKLRRGPKAARALVGSGSDRAVLERALRALERDGLVVKVQTLVGRAFAFRTELVATLTAAGLSHGHAESQAAVVLRGAKQHAALEALAGAPGGLNATTLRSRGVDLATLRRLAARGLVHLAEERRERDPFTAETHVPAPEADRHLTAEQEVALSALCSLLDQRRFHTALLHGVTGSGKTELYLRLAAHAIAAGRRVLILVPEIALTPQMVGQVRAVFGTRVAIQHSGLADGERHDQWHRVREGAVDLVVGTRSAVFTPLDALGLIIVDEEHDTSYKQEETPRYHGRDVAVVRARQVGALVVLGSATPALETYHNAETGRYARAVLSKRVLDRPLADVQIVDMREEYATEGPDVILSARLADAIGRRLAAGEQSLLLLNRRGFATTVFCRQCGHILDCPNCSVSLTVHRRSHGAARAVCHYCNHSVRVPTACEKCAAPYLEQAGFGTERVEAEVRRLFESARVGRVDRDTMQRRGAIQRVLHDFRTGALDLLVGTQMIAKGHDFPAVTLVGVISADVGLGLADFRAAERTFQLLTQVAGRAGRGTQRGEAIVQTLHPDHYSIRLATRQDYPDFYREELRYRQAMRYPPAVALINVVVRGPSFADAMNSAADLVARLEPRHAFAVLGPAPAPLAKLRGEYRAQFFMKGRHRTAMRESLVRAIAGLPELARRITVDVDPVGML